MKKRTKYSIALLSVVVVVGASIWFMYSIFADKERDDTNNITELMNRNLSIDRPWFLEVHDDGQKYLTTGRFRDSYPRTVEEFESNPSDSYNPPIIGVIPPKVPFRILKLTFISSMSYMYYNLTIEFLDGVYKGKQFDVTATEVLESTGNDPYSEHENWSLRSGVNVLD